MLKSDSFLLRAVEPADADFMFEIENDADCWRYGETVAPLSRRIIRDYALNYEGDPFAARQLRLIAATLSGQQIGVVDLYEIDPIHRRAFVGIYILPFYRNKGFALEALKLLASYAREVLRLRLLAARVESINGISLQLFTNAGYKKAALIPAWFLLPDDNTSDLIVLIYPLTTPSPQTLNSYSAKNNGTPES